jgi:hypothetical protein
MWAIVIVFWAFSFGATAQGAVVEADPDLQSIMGDLYALSAAMRLYREDAQSSQCPSLDQLERYFKKPLPGSWPNEYQTATIGGGWWVGRRVPEFSRARKFLRSNAPALGLCDKESGNAWLGQPFVWIEALSFKKETPFKIAEGEEKEHLFFNSPGTDYYWWSDLLFAPNARVTALVKYGTTAGVLAIPPAPVETRETFTASPVAPPPGFTVGNEDEDEAAPPSIEMGDVIFNPVPRPRNR